MEELKTARAQLVHARIAPRKVQIVCDMIRGKDTKVAEAYMANTPKAGCELMLKLLKSACANAENNFEMDPDNLYVAEAYATAGPILKRGQALLLALAVGDDRIHGIGRFKDFRRRNNGLQTLHHLLGRETRVPDGGHQLVH